MVVVAAVMVAALLFVPAAFAHSHVGFGISIGVGNCWGCGYRVASPVYYTPAYPPAVYYYPGTAYYAPPAYYPPPAYYGYSYGYYAPYPYYRQYRRGYRPGHDGHGGWRHGGHYYRGHR